MLKSTIILTRFGNVLHGSIGRPDRFHLAGLGTQVLERGEDFVGVGVGFDLGPDLADASVGADEEGDAVGALVLAAHEGFLTPDSIGFHPLTVDIGEQGKGQAEFFGEGLVFADGIGADAQHDGPGLGEGGMVIAETAGFLGAPRGVVLGVEIEYHPFPEVILERHRGPILGGEGESGCRVAFAKFEFRFGHGWMRLATNWSCMNKKLNGNQGPAQGRGLGRWVGCGLGLALGWMSWAAGVVAPGAAAAPGQVGWTSLFDGRSLAGWSVSTSATQYWTVEEGAITGRITQENPCTVNQYLVWEGGELADFELKLESRLRGEGGINNGFQFRSRLLPDGDVCGYQVDNNLETPWLVRLYDEYGRHTLAWRGERTVFDLEGQRTTTTLEEGTGPAWFRLEDWHEYHLTCVGSKIVLRVDGRVAAEVVDEDRQRRDAQGILALQLHSGPPTEVQFRNIRVRMLKPAASAEEGRMAVTPRQEVLRASAVAWWPLDEGGHGAEPRLKHHPEWDRFELNVAAVGPGARAGERVVLLDGAHFDAGTTLHAGVEAMTVYLRLRNPEGKWESALMGKGTGNEDVHFDLSATDLPGTPGPDVLFEVGTDRGVERVSVPVTAFPATDWVDVVGRYDGREMVLSVNGEVVARRGHGGRLRRNDAALWIGAAPSKDGATRHFRGGLATAAMWSRALTEEEVRVLSGRE